MVIDNLFQSSFLCLNYSPASHWPNFVGGTYDLYSPVELFSFYL
jgi:hypothetical protein